ncbi:hypothetical protein [Klebsiella quasivariicola]|uniref:hypothetical protein n=1 Tax=Klebsiella quasivariicola TaxID=2026240 RepID=UPI003F9D2DE4
MNTTELAQREKFEAWVMTQICISKSTLEGLRTAEGYRNTTLSGTDYNRMWAAWKAAGAELVEALEKAQQEAEELSKFKEVMTSAAEALKAGEPLNLESLFKGELASAMFAMMFAGEFVRSGATNYLELLYDVPEFGEMTVTLQKVEGKTPGQRIAELESRTVKLPQRHITQFRKGFNGYHNEMAYKADEVQASLAAAGIKVEAEMKIRIVLQELKEDGVLTTYSNGHVEMLPYRIDENGEEYVEMFPNDIEQH